MENPTINVSTLQEFDWPSILSCDFGDLSTIERIDGLNEIEYFIISEDEEGFNTNSQSSDAKFL